MRAIRAGVLLAAVTLASLAACSNDATSPTTTTPTPTGMSALARQYLTNALDFEQAYFLYGDKINWTTMRADVFTKAANAQKTSDTYDAIQYSIDHYFRPLGDLHSGFWPPSEAPGRVDAPASNPLYLASGATLGNVAYLYVPTFTGTNPNGRADSILTVIKQLDASKPCGWILDLRNNPGGTWAAMIAGIAPLIGNGQFAGLVDGDNNKAYFYQQNGVAGIYDPSTGQNYPQYHTSTTYTLSHPNAPVAILQGPLTASAGEILILAFKGGAAPTRSFGTNTYGLTTTPAGTYLPPDSAYLNITAAVMFDRSGKVYGGVIAPDVVIPSDTTQVHTPGAKDASTTAALAWLASRPECGGSGAVEAEIARPRFNALAFPQQAAPRARPLNVSPYFIENAPRIDAAPVPRGSTRQ